MGPISRLKQLLSRAFAGAPSPTDAARPWWDHDQPVRAPASRDVSVVRRVVDNRVFLLGLDELYRTAMKRHERAELLGCAERVSAALRADPADVPVEGYYAEDPALTAYFRLMRALQQVPLERAPEVEAMPEFRRLLDVTSSPMYGSPVREFLLPSGRDPLSAALMALDMADWTVPLLTAAAARVARDTDDCSLVGLAARAEDPVVLAALRESVVLYAMMVTGSAPVRPIEEYLWQVDPALAAAARRFVDAFNGLFGRELPPPTPKYARVFCNAFSMADIFGRCVRLGRSDPPVCFYHWGIRRGPEDQLSVHEFWHTEIVTTERYRRGDLPPDGQVPPTRLRQ